jgi:hypothetical protein
MKRHNYKAELEKLNHKYENLIMEHVTVIKDARALINLVLRIKRRCEAESMWLGASRDPYLPLTTEDQQGPLITKLYEMVQELKRKLK